ncbi:MAG: hypothetical protein GQ533_00845 [Methanosarcinaceae archaeon]|nr:hypothetical protein [Methanosarcinaceae archaeon]
MSSHAGGGGFSAAKKAAGARLSRSLPVRTPHPPRCLCPDRARALKAAGELKR